MTQYTAFFDFTTVHRGSRFVGRNGQCFFESKNDMDKVWEDQEQVKKLCAWIVLNEKPKWKIFTIDITDIKIYQP